MNANSKTLRPDNTSARTINRYSRHCPIDHPEEFADGEDFVNQVEFSPHDAEMQRMFWEEPSAMIPSSQFIKTHFPDGVAR